MKKRTFDSFNTDELEDIFGIRRTKNIPGFSDWLNVSNPVADDYVQRIRRHQNLLIDNADAWNEDELKLFFIGPFLNEAELHTDRYKPFTQRNMSFKLPDNSLEINGKVEFMLAKGRVVPKKPFFFLHEYKQERRRETDPLAQVLVAMLAARTYNQNDFPDYGCYVIGRLWFFVYFVGNDYEVSLAYDATHQEDILKIFSIVCEIKNIAQRVFA
ncbi:MAG: hypothetical protein RLZZ292_2747 [Bacteroidota bacterium]|jgi:hypothetical protein